MKNIFISSTFRDMHAERDLVQERVIPSLRAEARKYGDNVEAIDLRWGVDTSMLETNEGSAKVLKVCLDEIDRSHPYMLIFLGERYGWIPEGEIIEKAVKSRGDKYITDDFEKSVTALEIEYGALSEKYGDIKHCVVCFRESVTERMDEGTKNIYTEQEEKGIKKLQELKERIRKDLGEDGHLITYTATWDESAHTLVDLQADGKPLEEVLTRFYIEMFQQDWKEYEKLSWQEKEQLGFKALMESKLRSFVGREELLETYYQKVINGTEPLLLQGEVGSGKTSIMCKLEERLQKEGKNVFYFFAGTGNMSNNVQSLMSQMVFYIERLLGIEKSEEKTEECEEQHERSEKESEYESYLVYLKVLCNRLQEEVYFCIDALDQLYLDEHLETLDFLIRNKNVKFVMSCTDSFALASAAAWQVRKESIPLLNIEDVKVVAEGILKSYSRDIYEELKQEILKKKNSRSPLYISLLIQRLNMMDQDELEKLDTADAIKSYSINLIRQIPEELDAAANIILEDAIEKINGGKGTLQDVLFFLAVSRNGLRINDLQQIFESKQEVFSVLDFTILMKYLDGFFYFGEDDRIDVTHKIIRQGLLKEIANRKDYEERIKEHIKSLDSMDNLRMQEGFYYAGKTKDYAFANAILEQTYETLSETLVRTIVKEAVEDEGDFCCEIIAKEEGRKRQIRDLFLWKILDRFELSQKEVKTRVRIAETLAACLQIGYEDLDEEKTLKDLSVVYCKIGDTLIDQGKLEEALSVYGKMEEYTEKLFKSQKSQASLKTMAVVYDRMGDAFFTIGQTEKALVFYGLSLEYAEGIDEEEGEYKIRELSVSYRKIGDALGHLGRLEEALEVYEKSLDYAKQLYEQQKSEKSLRALYLSYSHIGDILTTQEKDKEAQEYYEEALKYAVKRYEIHRNQTNLRDISIGFNHIGDSILSQGNPKEALAYYVKALGLVEELHESQKNQTSLKDLSISYKKIGDVLHALGEEEKAREYYERSLSGMEELHESQKNQTTLRDISLLYANMGTVLQAQKKEEEAQEYYEKSLSGMEELHKIQKSIRSLQELANSYNNMGGILWGRNLLDEALVFYSKGLECRKELLKQQNNDITLRGISISYSYVGDILLAQEKAQEARACYEKTLKNMKQINNTQKSERSLNELAISYKKMGYTFYVQKKPEEAVLYFIKNLDCREEIYARFETPFNLQELMGSYDIVINILCAIGREKEAVFYYEKKAGLMQEDEETTEQQLSLMEQIMYYDKKGEELQAQGRMEEALTCYSKSLSCAKQIHAEEKSLGSLQDLGIGYVNMGNVLAELGREEDAELSYKNGLACLEEIHEKQRSEISLRILIGSYNAIIKLLCSQGREKEAAIYYMKVLKYKEEM